MQSQQYREYAIRCKLEAWATNDLRVKAEMERLARAWQELAEEQPPGCAGKIVIVGIEPPVF